MSPVHYNARPGAEDAEGAGRVGGQFTCGGRERADEGAAAGERAVRGGDDITNYEFRELGQPRQ